MGGMMAGMGIFGFLVIITVVAVLVVAVLGSMRLWRRRPGGATPVTSTDTARDALRERYASGEIDDEEFERRLAALTWR